jgi:hypothetical protein
VSYHKFFTYNWRNVYWTYLSVRTNAEPLSSLLVGLNPTCVNKYSTSLQIITYKLGESWNLMQLTEAMYHFALAITYQGQEMNWEKWNGILIVCHHFNTIIFSVTGNTYTLIANTNNLEGGCCKLKKRLSVKVHIATIMRWDCKLHILCRSIITSFAKKVTLPIHAQII